MNHLIKEVESYLEYFQPSPEWGAEQRHKTVDTCKQVWKRRSVEELETATFNNFNAIMANLRQELNKCKARGNKKISMAQLSSGS